TYVHPFRLALWGSGWRSPGGSMTLYRRLISASLALLVGCGEGSGMGAGTGDEQTPGGKDNAGNSGNGGNGGNRSNGATSGNGASGGNSSGTTAGEEEDPLSYPLLGSSHGGSPLYDFCEGKSDATKLPADPRTLVVPGANKGKAVYYNAFWVDCHKDPEL